MAIVKKITVKKNNSYSTLVGDKILLNSNLKMFYDNFKKNPHIWNTFDFFDKAKIIAYVAIVLNNQDEITIDDQEIVLFEQKVFSEDINIFLKNDIKIKIELIKKIENLLAEIEQMLKLYIKEKEFKDGELYMSKLS